MTKRYSGLFLHGGPGSSAIPERKKLGDDLGIDRWTQPRPAGKSDEPY